MKKMYEFNIGTEHSITIVQEVSGEVSSMIHSELIGILKNTKRDHTYREVKSANILRVKMFIDSEKSLENAFEYVIQLNRQLGRTLQKHKIMRDTIDKNSPTTQADKKLVS